MSSKISNTFSNMFGAVTSPEKTFHKGDYLKSSVFLILVILYVVTVISSFISVAMMNRPELQEFTFSISMRQVEKRMIGASEADLQMAEEQIRASLNNPAARIGQYISTLISGILFFVVPLLFWALQNIMARFLGGEESSLTIEKKKGPKTLKHRGSLLISLYAYIPIALNSLIVMIIVFFRDPESLTNVLTMEDLMAKMDINFSLTGLLITAELPVFLDTLLSTLTSPFYWWMFYIVFFGLKEIWRLKTKGAVTILSAWILLISIYEWGSYTLATAFTS